MPEPTIHSDRLHVGYILKQYPRLSETFVLNEILGLEANHVELSIFSLRHATEGRFHPGIASVKGPVHYVADLDKTAFLDALQALPDLRVDRLIDVLDFVGQVPAERRSRLVLNAIEIAKAAKERGVNHLHAHFVTVAAQTAHLVHLLTGLPYSVTAHAKDIYRYTVDWALAARIAADATAVVTVCDANLRFLAHRLDGTDARIVRIYNGLGPQEAPSTRADRIDGLVLGVGRMVEKKGFDLLLDAVAELAPARPDLHCVLVGDGDDKEALESKALQLGILDRVTFTGPLPQNKVADWMRRAEVLCAPCRVGDDGNQDALPTVLLEALGAGTPVVTTAVAGIPEIINNGVEGLLVDCDSSRAMAAGIVALLDNAALADSMSAAGPPKLAEKFDRANTITQLIEIFATAQPSAAVTSLSAA